MKKLFVVLVAAAFCFGAMSCSKVCSCTEKTTNFTVSDIDLKGQSVYKNCNEYQKALNDAAILIGEDQKWECTSK